MQESNEQKMNQLISLNNELDNHTMIPHEVDTSNKYIKDVEESLGSFTRHSFDIVSDEYKFQKKIEEEIERRLDLTEKEGGFSSKELIALQSNNFVNLNDRISKMLGPTFQLMTEEVRADIESRRITEKSREGNVNISIGQQSDSMGKEQTQTILQGMTQLYNLLSELQKADGSNTTEV